METHRRAALLTFDGDESGVMKKSVHDSVGEHCSVSPNWTTLEPGGRLPGVVVQASQTLRLQLGDHVCIAENRVAGPVAHLLVVQSHLAVGGIGCFLVGSDAGLVLANPAPAD